MNREFTPKFFSLLKEGIPRKVLLNDLIAGVVVGIVALPLAIAFAIASGVSPERGLVTAIVAGFVISFLGGSRVQIGGPTGAFIVIVFGVVSEFGVEGLIIATVMAGVMMIGFGLARLGNYLKFVPYPLIVGFTSGIALIIFSSQMNDFFGLGVEEVPADFVEKWSVYFKEAGQINFYAAGIAVVTVLVTLYAHKVTRILPGSLFAILIFSAVTYFLNLPVETIGSRFGELPNKLTIPAFPEISLSKLQSLIQPAFAIALLGAIESLLSAVVSDGMIGARHRPNIELIAQGSGNILSGIFGGIPATGAIARTATNVKNGGRTPVAGMVHALVLLFIMLIFAPYATLIPMSCLAGVLVVVAYNMSEWRQFRSILKSRNADIIILLTTFLLTVIFDLIIAIEVGIVLSSFLFMKRMSESLSVREKNIMLSGRQEDRAFESPSGIDKKKVLIYEINGPLFFGAAQQFQDTLFDTYTFPEYVIIRMRYVPFIDTTGYYRLREIIDTFHKKGIVVLLSGISENLQEDFEKNKLYDSISRDRVFEDTRSANDWIENQAVAVPEE